MASPGSRAWRRCPHWQPNHHHHHHHCLHNLCHHHHHHHHCLHNLCHHHHHHCYHFLPTCARHYHHLNCPFQGNLNFSLPLPQKPESFITFPLRNNSNVGLVEYKEDDGSAAQISQELELDEEEDDDDEPIFVLTDEWRDFFAKSEARRRLEKQSKKGKKKT